MSARLTYGPKRVVLAGQLAGAVALLTAAVLSDDRGGLVLGGAAGLLVLGVAIHDVLVRPVLVADADGVTVAEGLSRRTIGWAQVQSVRATTEVRRGVRSRLLEIDTGETLVLLSQRRLGADPAAVADAVEGLRAGSVRR